ncbi:hypothetical protein TcasGA2_TC001644 [Tribolium castaneum]|uniref:Uncharacterized protein n=1 Tax=Tribolium castaneum TaxID=7070 RepID=D6X1N5_TRICA|nr:hypothetical protein TcasGA2_TC001644 [Tribolium castaneum]
MLSSCPIQGLPAHLQANAFALRCEQPETLYTDFLDGTEESRRAGAWQGGTTGGRQTSQAVGDEGNRQAGDSLSAVTDSGHVLAVLIDNQEQSKIREQQQEWTVEEAKRRDLTMMVYGAPVKIGNQGFLKEVFKKNLAHKISEEEFVPKPKKDIRSLEHDKENIMIGVSES